MKLRVKMKRALNVTLSTKLKIELKDDGPLELPRPYRRRYSPPEIKWWDTEMVDMRAAGVVRRSSSGQLSPSNLVPKKLDGVILEDDFRMIVDMRGVNKRVKPLHFALPKLDTLIHHLSGSEFFAKGDDTKGYWQCDLEESSRAYTAFDCPAVRIRSLPQNLRVRRRQ